MRITIVQGAFLPVPPILGGAVEKVWFDLGREFARRGHRVTHISRCCPPFPSEEVIDGVQHVRVRGFDTPASPVRLKWRDLRYSRRVLGALPDADIVVTNTFWLPLLLRDPRAGKIYIHVARYPKGQCRFYRKAARLQTVSRPVMNAICREAPALASRVTVIPYFVDSSALSPFSTQRRTRILYVGRIHPEKGIHLLLDAFARIVSAGLSDWTLRIVGPWDVKHGGGGDEYFSSLRKRARQLRDLVEWAGPIFDAHQLRAQYGESTVFVYPSLAERGETFGLAALEAMAAGCPPIVSSLACFQDFIKNGFNGWTFDHRSDGAANLAAALHHVIGQEDRISKVRQHALQTAQEYNLAKVADRFLCDFEEIRSQ